jgi:hypothetical protein
VDLIDLDLVTAVAETGSITHGAARARLSLPSASGRIRSLEHTGIPTTAASRGPEADWMSPHQHRRRSRRSNRVRAPRERKEGAYRIALSWN